ncbi:MAG TPA: ABC transporter ATP-binding protein [Dermatophilaceae bacterium]|nr:ABC transporter ATP-binding protein [Dermatophilaceae bacterium]
MTAVITIRGLTKSYGGRAAVDSLDLEVTRGEIFALLGPNGAGKTTTVEILEGFRRRDGGEVDVLGADPGKADRAWRNRIGIVLQSSGGLDLLTVREVLHGTARAYSAPRGVEEVIGDVGLGDKADARISGLSGGQRRRLDVALGIVGRLELLFLDEPTTGFDPQARRDFWELIRTLGGAGGTTILLTTHYLDEAEQLADRVGVIAGGRMLALDSPGRLGGRDSEEATVSWDEGGVRRSLRTAHPTAEVQRVAQRFGGEVPGLVVSRPSLEETYLSLIGPHVERVTTEVMSP